MPQFGQADTAPGACDIVRVIIVDMGSLVVVMRRHEACTRRIAGTCWGVFAGRGRSYQCSFGFRTFTRTMSESTRDIVGCSKTSERSRRRTEEKINFSSSCLDFWHGWVAAPSSMHATMIGGCQVDLSSNFTLSK